MTTPTSLTAEAVACATSAPAAAGVLTVCGSLLGLQYEVVLLGMLGGIIGLTFTPPAEDSALPFWRRVIKSAAMLVACGIFAGGFTRLVEAMVPALLPQSTTTDAVHLAVAIGLGIVAPIAVPWLRARLAEFRLKRGGSERPGGDA